MFDEGFERVAYYGDLLAAQVSYYITNAYSSVHVSCCDLL